MNQRLAKEEAASSGAQGDPQHPKKQWPSSTLCTKCTSSSSSSDASSNVGQGEENPRPDVWKEEGVAGRWSMPDVYAFLKEFYEEPDTEELKPELGGTDPQHSHNGSVHKLGGGFVTAEGAEKKGSVSMILVVVTGCVLLAVAAACTWQLARRSFIRASPHRRRKLPGHSTLLYPFFRSLSAI